MDIAKHKRGFVGFALTTLCALLIVYAVSCQGRVTATPIDTPPPVIDMQPVVTEQQEQADSMPSPLDALHESSVGSFGYVNRGPDFEEGLAHRRVVGYGEIAAYTPYINEETSLYGSAYAIYRFDFTNHVGNHSLTTTWNPEFENWDNLYLGLSDWSNNRWHWQQTEQGLLTDPAALTPYIDENQQLLIVVALNRGQRGELEWLYPGTFPDSPVVLLNASTVYGDPPLIVEFDASKSFFLEGTPYFEWDKDSDGIYEDQNTSGVFTTIYEESGEYTATVKASFPGGIVGTSSVGLVVRENSLLLSADWQDTDWHNVNGNGSPSGPYKLYLEASRNDYTFKATNAETGEAVPFEGLTWHYSPPDEQPFEMVTPGVIHCKQLGQSEFYVKDDEGRQSNLQNLEVVAFEGEPLVAGFSIEDTAGVYPFRVDFDHSSTTGGATSNAWYEWDYDGDGVFDFAHMGYYDLYHAHPSHIYHEEGEYRVELRVTDYAGIWDTTSTWISVIGTGPRWHFEQAGEFASYWVDGGVEANGKPGLFLSRRVSGLREHYFAIAQDSLGTQWNDPVLVDPTPDDEWTVAKAGLINGVPAMFIHGYNSFDSGTGLRYFEAQDAEGISWSEPQTVSPSPNSEPENFLDNNGSPCLVVWKWEPNNNTYRFIGYDGLSGENGWFEVDVATGYFDNQDVSSAVIDGKPAIAYTEHDPDTLEPHLMFVRALDSEGKTWGTPTSLVSGTHLKEPSLNVINGIPGISYFNEIDHAGTANYLVALDSTGVAWDNPVEIFPAENDWTVETKLLEWNNKPYVFIRDWEDTFCSLAQDSSGSAWNPKQAVGADLTTVTIVDGIPFCGTTLGGGKDDWNEVHEPPPSRRYFGAYY